MLGFESAVMPEGSSSGDQNLYLDPDSRQNVVQTPLQRISKAVSMILLWSLEGLPLQDELTQDSKDSHFMAFGPKNQII